MPTLILEDVDSDIWEDEDAETEIAKGSDDRWPNKTSRSVQDDWFLSEKELYAYRLSLLSLLE